MANSRLVDADAFALADLFELTPRGDYAMDRLLALTNSGRRSALQQWAPAERVRRQSLGRTGQLTRTVDPLPPPSPWSALITAGKWYLVVLLAAWCFWMTWGR